MDGPLASESRVVFATDTARELVALPDIKQDEPIHHHSLVVELNPPQAYQGGGVARFREFVTFHGEYTYPDFVVAYKRTVGTNLRAPVETQVSEGVPPR